MSIKPDLPLAVDGEVMFFTSRCIEVNAATTNVPLRSPRGRLPSSVPHFICGPGDGCPISSC